MRRYKQTGRHNSKIKGGKRRLRRGRPKKETQSKKSAGLDDFEKETNTGLMPVWVPLLRVLCDGPSIMGQVGVQSQRWRLESGVLACQWTLKTRNDIKIELCERWVEWISGDRPAHSTQSRGRDGGWWTAAGDWGLGIGSLC